MITLSDVSGEVTKVAIQMTIYLDNGCGNRKQSVDTTGGNRLKRHYVFCVLLFCIATSAHAASGEVIYKQSGCDYYVVQTNRGYDVLEWYGGHDPDKGDLLVGKFEEYGMHDIFDQTADDETKVWVEEYWLSKESALETLVEKCE